MSSPSLWDLRGSSRSLADLAASDQPYVLAGALGQVQAIYAAFTRVCGWCEPEMVMRSSSVW